MLIGHLTDTHVIEDPALHEVHVDNNGRAVEAIAAMARETPALDLVLLTGDLTNTGTPEQFDILADVVAGLDVPTLAIPGNHDTRAGVRRVFPHLDWVDADHASCVLDLDDEAVGGGDAGGAGPVRIIGLDTTIPGLPGAELDDERLEWLAAAIEGSPGRTVVAMHHPPFLTGIRWMDDSGFIGRDRFAAVIADHPVERILCGHIHRQIVTTVGGSTVVTAPSTVQHVALDLDPSSTVSLILDPPAYLIHQVTAEGWVTHTRFFATGEEAIRPAWATD